TNCRALAGMTHRGRRRGCTLGAAREFLRASIDGIANRNLEMAIQDFATALVRGDLEAVRACSKADLHTHCAKVDRDYLRQRTGRDIQPITTPLGSMDEMHAWATANIGDLFHTPAGRTLCLEA